MLKFALTENFNFKNVYVIFLATFLIRNLVVWQLK
jgi:hypothetical protein